MTEGNMELLLQQLHNLSRLHIEIIEQAYAETVGRAVDHRRDAYACHATAHNAAVNAFRAMVAAIAKDGELK